jgi:hypothetical protein
VELKCICLEKEDIKVGGSSKNTPNKLNKIN